jgi:hypothetical protein
LHHLRRNLQWLLNISSRLRRERSDRNHGAAENGGERSAEEEQTQRIKCPKVANQSERRGIVLTTVTAAGSSPLAKLLTLPLSLQQSALAGRL